MFSFFVKLTVNIAPTALHSCPSSPFSLFTNSWHLAIRTSLPPLSEIDQKSNSAFCEELREVEELKIL